MSLLILSSGLSFLGVSSVATMATFGLTFQGCCIGASDMTWLSCESRWNTTSWLVQMMFFNLGRCWDCFGCPSVRSFIRGCFSRHKAGKVKPSSYAAVHVLLFLCSRWSITQHRRAVRIDQCVCVCMKRNRTKQYKPSRNGIRKVSGQNPRTVSSRYSIAASF